jgi:hypothetical protein
MPRAALHSFRRLPLSSPDKDHDSSHVPPLSLSVNPAADLDMTSGAGHCLGTTPERRFQSRRTSTLSYQNSGARHLRDPSYSRSPRNLVVVIPPPDLPLDQGHLGSVLSTGPRSRLSQGILMPLFPSVGIWVVCRTSSRRNNSLSSDVWTAECHCSRIQLSKYRRTLPLPLHQREWHNDDTPYLR